MKITKTTWFIIGGVALMAAGTGIYLFVLRNKNKNAQMDQYGNLKLKATGKDKETTGGMGGGILTSKGVHSTAVTEPNWDNPFDINYYKDVKKWVAPKALILLRSAAAKQYAKQLYDAKSIVQDDVDAVYNVFSKKVSDKVQVSNVSEAFWNVYRKDLMEYLTSFLSDSEMEKYVQSPVRNLVNYRVN